MTRQPPPSPSTNPLHLLQPLLALAFNMEGMEHMEGVCSAFSPRSFCFQHSGDGVRFLILFRACQKSCVS